MSLPHDMRPKPHIGVSMFPSRPNIDMFRLKVGENTVLQYDENDTIQLGARVTAINRRLPYEFSQKTLLLVDPKTLETVRILIVTRTA